MRDDRRGDDDDGMPIVLVVLLRPLHWHSPVERRPYNCTFDQGTEGGLRRCAPCLRGVPHTAPRAGPRRGRAPTPVPGRQGARAVGPNKNSKLVELTSEYI